MGGNQSCLSTTKTRNQMSWKMKDVVVRTSSDYPARKVALGAALGECLGATMVCQLLSRIQAYALPSDQPMLRYVAGCVCNVRKLPGRSRTPSSWARRNAEPRTRPVGCVIAESKDGDGVCIAIAVTDILLLAFSMLYADSSRSFRQFMSLRMR